MKKIFKGFIRFIVAVVLVLGIIATPIIKSGYTMYKHAVEQTPIEEKVAEIRLQEGYTDFEDISPDFIDELLHSEDRRFYYHFAIDPIALMRAVLVNVLQGKYVQGGSTITQQLAKNMYFSFEKQLERKVAELFVAFQFEKMYTKDEILAMYCSMAYFGENCYGVKQAAKYYYNVEPSQLNQQQSKELVETLKAPSVYNPSTMK